MAGAKRIAGDMISSSAGDSERMVEGLPISLRVCFSEPSVAGPHQKGPGADGGSIDSRPSERVCFLVGSELGTG